MQKPISTSIFISEAALQQRVAALGKEIADNLEGKPLTVICALKGAMVFAADIIRQLPNAVELDFIGASSYRCGTTPSRQIQLTKALELDLTGKHVLLVEDIWDTGHTLAFLTAHLQAQNPASIHTCVLLDKPERRQVSGTQVDYIGFSIPDHFVVGYGLDYNQQYRNLPYIGLLHIK